MSYDDQNIFAKILRGELPAHRICEESETLAFMDIMPRSRGHLLVIPKAPSRNLLDIRPEDLCSVLRTAQRLARAAMTALGADGITLQQFSEPAGGQVVFHTHVHVIPRYDGIPLKPPASEMADDQTLKSDAEAIRKALDAS